MMETYYYVICDSEGVGRLLWFRTAPNCIPTRSSGSTPAYNPLRGLNLSRLTALQEAGERGQYADLQ